jgi:hypothetical protein
MNSSNSSENIDTRILPDPGRILAHEKNPKKHKTLKT